MLALSVSINTSFVNDFLCSMIRLQAKATKKPQEVENDFKKFVHKMVCFVF